MKNKMGNIAIGFFKKLRGALPPIILSAASFSANGETSSELISKGIQERNAGNIAHSILIFQQGVKDNPDNLRMKIELASSYYSNKEYEKAKSLAEEVLEANSIPDIVRENINNFVLNIDVIQRNSTAFTFKRFHNLSVYSGYDTNANIAPDDALIDIGELPGSSTERSGYFNAMMYDFMQFKPVTLSEDTSASLHHYNGLTLYSKNYNGFDDSDITFISARAGTKYTFSQNWFTKARLSASHVELDDKSLFNYINLSTHVGYHFGRSELSTQVSRTWKDNYQEKHNGRKGQHNRQALLYRNNITDTAHIDLKAANLDINLKDSSYSYDSSEFEAAYSTSLADKVRLNLSANYKKNTYRSPQQYYSDARKDEIFQYQIRLDVADIYKNIDSQLSYMYVDRNSNHEINVYDRHEIMLTLKIPFGI